MSNFKMLTTIALTALFAAPAFAQDTAEEVPVPSAEETLEPNFMAADLDQDGSLTSDEFVSFAIMRAREGDEGFKDLVLGGAYDAAFEKHDIDGSGALEMSELSAQKSAPESSEEEPEFTDLEPEDMPEPDLN